MAEGLVGRLKVEHVTEETKQTLRDISTEIGVGRVLLLRTEREQIWNDAHDRTLQIIQNYAHGVGLFQLITRKPTATPAGEAEDGGATAAQASPEATASKVSPDPNSGKTPISFRSETAEDTK